MSVQTEEMNTLSAQPVEENVPKKSKKSMPLGIRIILCFLLSAVLLAAFVIETAAAAVRISLTEQKISTAVENTDYMSIPISADGIITNPYEIIYSIFGGISAEKTDIYELAEKTDLEDTIAEYVYSYACFILYDDRPDELSADAVKTFYDKNASKISRAFGVNPDNETIHSIIDNQEPLWNKLSRDNIEDSVPAIGLIRFAMSPAGMITVGVIALIMIILIGLTSKRVSAVITLTGVSASITGLAGTVGSALLMFGAPIPTAAEIALQGVISSIVPDLFTIFVYILTAGILLILTGGFICRIKKNVKLAKNS